MIRTMTDVTSYMIPFSLMLIETPWVMLTTLGALCIPSMMKSLKALFTKNKTTDDTQND